MQTLCACMRLATQHPHDHFGLASPPKVGGTRGVAVPASPLSLLGPRGSLTEGRCMRLPFFPFLFRARGGPFAPVSCLGCHQCGCRRSRLCLLWWRSRCHYALPGPQIRLRVTWYRRGPRGQTARNAHPPPSPCSAYVCNYCHVLCMGRGGRLGVQPSRAHFQINFPITRVLDGLLADLL